MNKSSGRHQIRKGCWIHVPRISIIAALNENRVIGKDDKLLWCLPADLEHFRQVTTGKPVIMGRRTYESMGKPLKERGNLILTNRPDYRVQGCVVVHSISEAMEAVRDQPEVMVIGGASVYCQFLPLADRLYLTLVHNTLEGDALFPEVSKEEWREIERAHRPADDRNPWPLTFLTLDRIRPDLATESQSHRVTEGKKHTADVFTPSAGMNCQDPRQ